MALLPAASLPPSAPSSPSPSAQESGQKKARGTPAWWRLVEGISRPFWLDPTSLAVFRIGLAVLILVDAWVALGNADVFYSDEGILTRQLLISRLWESSAKWSFHLLSGSVLWQQALAIVQMVAGVALLVGWRTRWVTVVCWALICSQETRNPLVGNGADSVMRLLLFWSIFLPLGSRASLDARRRGGGEVVDSMTPSVPAFCFILQVAFVYFFASVLKNWQVWLGEGSALQTALQLDAFARPAGVWLREKAGLCAWLTRVSLCLEALAPFMLLVPWGTALWRVVLASCFIAFHAGIALFMDIGMFPWVMIVAWFALLPGAVWQSVGTFFQRALHRRAAAQPLDAAEPAGSHVAVAAKPTPWLVRAFCLFCITFVLLWNLRGISFEYWAQWFPRSFNPIGLALRLDQHWSMFAPAPSKDNGWFVLRAGLSDGSEVDLLRQGQPTHWAKPALQHATYKDSRWQKILMNLWLTRYHEYRVPFCETLVRRWNASQGGLSQVVAWQFYFVTERSDLPDGVERHLMAEGSL